MRGDLVEKQDRRHAARRGGKLRMRKDEADQQRLLLAGRGERGWHVLFGENDLKVAPMWAEQRPPRSAIGDAIFCERAAIPEFRFGCAAACDPLFEFTG